MFDIGVVDAVREDGGEEIGESGIEREVVESGGNVERRSEGGEEVVEGGERWRRKRRRREVRDWEVEEGLGF